MYGQETQYPYDTKSIVSFLVLSVSPAAETLPQFAPGAAALDLGGYHELRFAVAAEIFLAGFHRAVTGSNGHWAKLDTTFALLAKLGTDAERVIHMAVLAPPDKADRSGLPDLGANSHAASA